MSANYFNFYLKDSDNNNNIIGDYKYDKKKFYYKNLLKSNITINKISVTLLASGAIRGDNYGGNCVLNNGITLRYTNTGKETEIINKSNPILSNNDWFFYTDTLLIPILPGSRNRIQKVIFKLKDNPIILKTNDLIEFTFNDDFSNLLRHNITIEGFYI